MLKIRTYVMVQICIKTRGLCDDKKRPKWHNFELFRRINWCNSLHLYALAKKTEIMWTLLGQSGFFLCFNNLGFTLWPTIDVTTQKEIKLHFSRRERYAMEEHPIIRSCLPLNRFSSKSIQYEGECLNEWNLSNVPFTFVGLAGIWIANWLWIFFMGLRITCLAMINDKC